MVHTCAHTRTCQGPGTAVLTWPSMRLESRTGALHPALASVAGSALAQASVRTRHPPHRPPCSPQGADEPGFREPMCCLLCHILPPGRVWGSSTPHAGPSAQLGSDLEPGTLAEGLTMALPSAPRRDGDLFSPSCSSQAVSLLTSLPWWGAETQRLRQALLLQREVFVLKDHLMLWKLARD